MSTAGSTPGSTPALSLGVFGWVVRGSNTLASLWIVVLMLLVVADVVLRVVANRPVVGVNEIMEISIVAMLYLQITQALRDGRHTRSDAFIGRLHQRAPRAAQALEAVFAAAGCVLMLLIISGAWPRLLEAWRGGFTIGNRGVFVVPEWPIRAVIVFGCATMVVQFALIGWRHARAALWAAPPGGPSGHAP